jgi:hypothetical protein
MNEPQKGARPAPASVEEDPNATVACSSPPCFMHELDPTYLGYLGREEVRALLGSLLAAEWGGAGPDEARLRAVLRRHFEALSGRPDHTACASHSVAAAEAPDRGPDGPARMVREALPRIHDDALRRDLEEALGALGASAR